MLEAARRLDGQILRTVRGREFKVGVFRDCPFFIPASTMLGRSDGRKAMENFVARFNELKSFRPVDYQGVTRNASYYLVLVDEVLNPRP